MNHPLCGLLAALVIAISGPTSLAAQVTYHPPKDVVGQKKVDQKEQKPAKKTSYKKVFKREVDGLINATIGAMRGDGSLGDGSALNTAQILTAMGNSHRFYTLGDGPVVRKPIHFLFTRRNASGAYADAGGDEVATTRWVLDALQITDPVEHRTELQDGAKWLNSKRIRDASPWQSRILALGEQMRRDGSNPRQAGADVAKSVARGPIRAADGSIDHARTTDALLHLVACQVIGRRIDKTGDPGGAAFSTAAQRGIDFLRTRQEDGVFFAATKDGKFPDTGLSGLGLAALQTKPVALRTKDEHAIIDAGLATLVKQQNDDGSFGRSTVNYTTCAAILALTMAKDPRFDATILKARNYVLGIQNIEDRGYAKGDRDYGSIGYGGDQRGDLSNLGFAVQALRETGLDENHEAFAKAIVFLQRTQNLRKVNDFEGRVKNSDGEWQTVESGDDGGSAYYPGNSPAGYDDSSNGKRIPRSYGSMTYMLLRTYTLCGIESTDHRVQSAIDWIQKHWTLDENPGSSPLLPEKTKYQGLYYYYMVLAQALDNAGIDRVEATDEGKSKTVDWRTDLAAKLASLQREDGSWLNDANTRWWEGQDTVCTIYALLALQRCAQ